MDWSKASIVLDFRVNQYFVGLVEFNKTRQTLGAVEQDHFLQYRLVVRRIHCVDVHFKVCDQVYEAAVAVILYSLCQQVESLCK